MQSKIATLYTRRGEHTRCERAGACIERLQVSILVKIVIISTPHETNSFKHAAVSAMR
jgi:hypothetical protein